MTNLDDHAFLTELARQLHDDSAAWLTGAGIAAALGATPAEAAPVVGRLTARGFIEPSPGAAERVGDGPEDQRIRITSAGYLHLGL